MPAIKSGMLAAEAAFAALQSGRSQTKLDAYTRVPRIVAFRRALPRPRNY